MKLITHTFFLFIFAMSLNAESLNIKDYDKKSILILGDSITQRGAYVNFLEYYIQTLAKDIEVDLLSVGKSGEKAVIGAGGSVDDRIDNILKQKKFDLVLACYGMNDGAYYPFSDERFNAYKAGIKSLTDKVTATGAKIIFMTPTLFENKTKKKKCLPASANEFSSKTPYEGYDDVLAKYSDYVLSLNKNSINLRAAMLAEKAKLAESNPSTIFAKDGIHPDTMGNLVMAQTIARALGLELPEGSLNEELKRISKDPISKLVKKYRGARSSAWLKYSSKGNVALLNGVEDAYKEAYKSTKNKVQ